VCQAVREQVGPDYPVFTKLGMMDGVENGLTPEAGAQIAGALEDMGLDALEISGGVEGDQKINVRPGIVPSQDEAYFRPLAREARLATQLPIILVGGFRSRAVMEEVLEDGSADFISLCRPFISEPDLPNRMRLGGQQESACISGNYCWPDKPGEGIACKCPTDKSL
jgi:2,4-dienoyl-CoA reductase-like NADH-dependent reductase (Old Yellow Enzyme family)